MWGDAATQHCDTGRRATLRLHGAVMCCVLAPALQSARPGLLTAGQSQQGVPVGPWGPLPSLGFWGLARPLRPSCPLGPVTALTGLLCL